MSVVLEVGSSLLFAAALILMVTTYESNQWSQSDTGTVFTQANTMSSGLWEECSSNADSGTETCATFDSFFLGLPLHLQAARAFTISALVFQAFGTVLTVSSISSVPCSSADVTIRNRVRMIGGLSGILAGISIIVGVSWYASTIMRSYYDTMYISPDTERTAFGTAIFIGWASGAVAVLGSVLAFCASCTVSGDRNELTRMPGQKVHLYSSNSATQEYV